MLARYHEKVAPLAKVEVLGTVVARTKTGTLVVPGSVDLLAWTPTIDRFVRRPDLKAATTVLWLSGQATPRARRELERRGWTVQAPAPGESSAPTGS
jgi:hypothetical protein